MNIEVRVDGIKELISVYTDLEKRQVPYALARALTQTAKDVKEAELKQLATSIRGGATSWTKRGLFTKSATKNKQVAEVGFKDDNNPDAGLYSTPAAKYMIHQVEGGQRQLKRFESALRWRGILPAGMYITPGAACMRDSYGNIPHGIIQQILSYFEASERWAGHTSNITAQGRLKLKKGTKKKIGIDYIVSHGPGTPTGRSYTAPQHLPPGIYKREYHAFGTRIRPMMMFVRQPSYQKRFPFYETAQKTINQTFRKNFTEAMNEAIRTAR